MLSYWIELRVSFHKPFQFRWLLALILFFVFPFPPTYPFFGWLCAPLPLAKNSKSAPDFNNNFPSSEMIMFSRRFGPFGLLSFLYSHSVIIIRLGCCYLVVVCLLVTVGYWQMLGQGSCTPYCTCINYYYHHLLKIPRHVSFGMKSTP